MIEMTAEELETLAEHAHGLGQNLYDAERDYRRADLERLALSELHSSKVFGQLANDARVRALWAWNFCAGWRTTEWATWCFEPAVDVGDYRPASEAQEEGQLR